MTTLQLHIGVNLGVQKIASNINDSLQPQEIDYFLNESVDDYIRQQYSKLKSKERDIEYEYVAENLRTLMTTAEIDTFTAVDHLPNSIACELPADYLYYIYSRSKLTDTWKNNVRLSQNAIVKVVETQTNSPQFREFPVLLENNKIIVMSDSLIDIGTDLTKVVLNYIKKPATIDLNPGGTPTDCDLPDHTHKEIVNLTVDKILSVLNVTGQ